MNVRVCNLLLTASVALIAAGCSTTKERAASFSIYANTSFGDEAITNFLRSRSAFLITGDNLTFNRSTNEPGVFTYHARNTKIEFGSATPIDRRGYFLTAAHCVGKVSPYLLFRQGNQSRVERASIVWRGDSAKKEPDLAVLCVHHRIDYVFEWASNFKVGDPVIAVGPNYDHSHDFNVAFFAGTILGSRASSGTNWRQTSISHSAPGHKGDSGGPLVTVNGRLLAINVGGGPRFSFLHPVNIDAARPDLVWLHQMIDAHSATQPPLLNSIKARRG